MMTAARLTATERMEALIEAAAASGRAVVNVPPLAKLLHCDENTIYRLIAAGRLPAIRLTPRRVVVPLHVVEKLLAGELTLVSAKEDAAEGKSAAGEVRP